MTRCQPDAVPRLCMQTSWILQESVGFRTSADFVAIKSRSSQKPVDLRNACVAYRKNL